MVLTSKQRAYLKKEGAKLVPVVQIGKAGVTPEVVESAAEALAARELIKGAVLDNCFDDVGEAANTVAERTRSELVHTIGRKFVLYKQSDKKLFVLPK
ncbi:MAG: YhbY family RNA-binding protein [Clostridiales bacterium]|nr:YhbY family RNA-binding protein [Clostridiales bacterium]